jgi:hypothetical protein
VSELRWPGREQAHVVLAALPACASVKEGSCGRWAGGAPFSAPGASPPSSRSHTQASGSSTPGGPSSGARGSPVAAAPRAGFAASHAAAGLWAWHSCDGGRCCWCARMGGRHGGAGCLQWKESAWSCQSVRTAARVHRPAAWRDATQTASGSTVMPAPVYNNTGQHALGTSYSTLIRRGSPGKARGIVCTRNTKWCAHTIC